MKILIACEYSGTVRDAFIAKGHDVISCDILDTDSPGPHYKGTIEDLLEGGYRYDMLIAHPPCTYICSSGLHWNNKRPEREQQTVDALAFVKFLWDLDIKKVAIENPVGCINTRMRSMPKPQYVQPWMFGDDASKKTGLWTRGLPKLVITDEISPRLIESGGRTYKRWGNQRDCGRDNTPNTVNRAKIRSKTFQGLADAMASQWT
jgi:hypothetical protein